MHASLISDQEFDAAARALIARAAKRLDICTFIFDVTPGGDAQLSVRRFAHMLKDAAEDGVELRLLIARASRGMAAISNPAAAIYCAALGVNCRIVPELHAKYMIMDRADVLLGGHNISARSFETNADVSLLLQDAPSPMVRELEHGFDLAWRNGEAIALSGVMEMVT